MFKFSEFGIKNKELFIETYSDFIDWCKSSLPSGTFSTYADGEPVCYYCGIEMSYSAYLENRQAAPIKK